MSDSHDEGKPMGALNSEFYNPVKLADSVVEPLKSYLENRDKLPMPSTKEIEQWSLSESELDRCAKEFVLMMAIGSTVTVMKNKPFEFYSAFIRALAPRLSQLMLGYQGITLGEELIPVIEKYIHDLEEETVNFPYFYTERVFGSNPKEAEICFAELWKRAFDLMMANMEASKQYFIGCITNEEECQLLGEGISIIRHEVLQLTKSIQAGTQQYPAEKIDSILKDIQPFWESAKLEDDELKLFVLHDCWYELKRLYRLTLQEIDLAKFDDDFYNGYMAQLFSLSSYVTKNGETLSSGMPVDRVLRVTEREIKLGRLPEDSTFRQNALKAKAEGKADLFWSFVEERIKSNPIVKVLDVVSRLKKIRSVLRIFGI